MIVKLNPKILDDLTDKFFDVDGIKELYDILMERFMAMEESKDTKMKTFVIQEKFVGYADITIEAETEEEAIALYNRGHYKDSQL